MARQSELCGIEAVERLEDRMSRLGAVKVLIVDDNPHMRDIATAVLKAAGLKHVGYPGPERRNEEHSEALPDSGSQKAETLHLEI